MARIDPRPFAIVLLVAACSPEAPNESETTNQAPTVWVSAGQPVASAESYSVDFTWGGNDTDGEIDHYDYIVTRNDKGIFDPEDLNGTWTSISATSATLTFPIDPEANAAGGEPSRTLVIRSVDNGMLPSETPDYLTFTAKSLAPAVQVTVPPVGLNITPADIPPVSTFEWDSVPGKEDPDSVQWALVSTSSFSNSYATTIHYLRTVLDAPEWGEWTWFDNPGGKGREWTTPPLDYGQYVFAVRGKKVAGAMNPVLTEPVNVRRVKVQARESGPTLVVQNSYYGHTISASCDFPLTIAEIAAGLPVTFTIAACADHYGGTVAGYRYGWDILDLTDPDQWEVALTPFPGPSVTTPPRAFAFGVHVFTAEAIDNSGYCSRIQVKLNIVRFTGERNLLIVDDYRADDFPGSGWAATNGAIPSDAEHDAFWLDMVSDLDQFDPAIDVVTTSGGQQVPMTTLARYKSIVWSSYGDVDIRNVFDLPYLAQFIQYRANLLPPCTAPTGGVQGEVVPNAIAQAMESGIHVLIAGNHPVQNIVPRFGGAPVPRWPMIPMYELETGATQLGAAPRYLAERPGRHAFAYQHLGLEAIDFGFLTSQRARLTGTGSSQRYCGITGLRSPNANSRRDDTMRAGSPIDPNFPAISLRPEAAAAGRQFAPSSMGLDVEVYNPAYFDAACAFVAAPRTSFEPIYGLDCLDTAELTYQQPVAFWTGAYADVIPQDFPGGVAARSAVFGFPPVYFNPSEIKPAIEHILFDEWQLPRSAR